jgi:hypothetical protein
MALTSGKDQKEVSGKITDVIRTESYSEVRPPISAEGVNRTEPVIN